MWRNEVSGACVAPDRKQRLTQELGAFTNSGLVQLRDTLFGAPRVEARAADAGKTTDATDECGARSHAALA